MNSCLRLSGANNRRVGKLDAQTGGVPILGQKKILNGDGHTKRLSFSTAWPISCRAMCRRRTYNDWEGLLRQKLGRLLRLASQWGGTRDLFGFERICRPRQHTKHWLLGRGANPYYWKQDAKGKPAAIPGRKWFLFCGPKWPGEVKRAGFLGSKSGRKRISFFF